MRPLIDELHAAVFEATGVRPAAGDWAATPNRALGDVAFPCFKLAKGLGKAPAVVAQELAPKIADIARAKGLKLLRNATATGPYVNAFFRGPGLNAWLGERLLGAKCLAGASGVGAGKTALWEYSSPNIAKEIGVHHLRSTAIGNALANLAELHGYKTVRINYLGDWGTAHGKNIMALKRFGSEAELRAQGLSYILDLYVQYNDLIKKQGEENGGKSEASDAARDAFKKLEQGDAESRRVWNLLREISLEEANRLYARLGVRFDCYDGESMYEKKMDSVVDEIQQKMGTRVSEGALVCDLPGHSLPVLLRKDDGASLYMTRDLAAAEDRYARYHFDHSFYVVAVQQKLHFEQLFGVLKALGKPYADKCEHIPFGMLSFGAKTMKSREGNIVFLKDVLDEAKRRAAAIIQEKNPELADADATAEMIGQGAVLFADLSQLRTKDLSFNWESALSFEGDTGPFLQYTHARCVSLLARTKERLAELEKAGGGNAAEAEQLLDEEPAVRQLLGDLAYFETFSERAWEGRDPSQISTSLLNVAKSFNQLYHKIRFLSETSAPRLRTLLALTDGTRALLAHGLGLLGIRAPREM